MGASGDVLKMKLVDNPAIPRKVDYIVSDDLRAQEQITALYDSDNDVYYLSNVLSSGVLGQMKGKRLVPTRWGITAVDDILGKDMIKRLVDLPEVSDIMVFENTYLENHFEILLMPGAWEFEMFECWAADTLWTQGAEEPTLVSEYEGVDGRREYAYNEGGGYYAGRFAVAEALNRFRRNARVSVFREIYSGHVMPVGVWEIRENVREALKKKPKIFSSVEDALKDIGGRLHLPMERYLRKSQILTQKRISDYV
jgi:hypothetical protein